MAKTKVFGLGADRGKLCVTVGQEPLDYIEDPRVEADILHSVDHSRKIILCEA